MVKITSLSVVPFAALAFVACGSDSTAPNEPITVTAIDPASGALAGGTSVTITGTNFIDVTGVTIGGSPLGNRNVVSSTQITGTTSAAINTGANDVVVTSSSHSSGVCSGCFTYNPPVTGARDQISAGWDHSCALTNAGAAYCWGSNTYGTLGNGSTTNSLTAVAVSGGLTFTTITSGGWHTCALTSAGDAYCWGNNALGQLGNGSTAHSSIPVAVAGGLKFVTLASTGDHTCALVASGAAYCWGKNDFGQFGNGTKSNGSTVPGSTTPVPVSGGLHFTALDAGGYHTCGIVGSGAAYCWGLNQSGQLGNGSQGTNVDALVPTAVSGGLVFTAIFTGFYHTCGLASDQTVYCWGSNLYGGLGDGSFMTNGLASGPDYCPTYPNTGACSVRPVVMPPGLGGYHPFTLGLGGYHTCGLANAGVAACWGADTYGQLGNGTTGMIGNTSNRSGVIGSATFPGRLAFKGIAPSITNYTCAIMTTGEEVYCWGRNDVGQLGDGTTRDSPVPSLPVSGFPPP